MLDGKSRANFDQVVQALSRRPTHEQIALAVDLFLQAGGQIVRLVPDMRAAPAGLVDPFAGDHPVSGARRSGFLFAGR